MRFFESNRAVNPVIGIVLLVGVAVILSATIGTFLIGLGSDLSGGSQAAVETSSVVNDEDDGFVTITAVSMQRADRISVEATSIEPSDGLDDGGTAATVVTEEIHSEGEAVTFQQHDDTTGNVDLEIVTVAHTDADGDDSSRILSTEVTI